MRRWPYRTLLLFAFLPIMVLVAVSMARVFGQSVWREWGVKWDSFREEWSR